MGLLIKQVKYGYLIGPTVIVPWPMAASQVIEPLSGKWIKLDSNDRVDIADSGDAQVDGWLHTPVGDRTSSATAGDETAGVDVSTLSIYGMKADDDPAGTRGETCDLIVNVSNIQQADVGESNEDVIKIYDINTDDDLVATGLNPTKAFAAGVA